MTTPVSATTSAASTASTTPAGTLGGTSAADQEDRFMKMLVAQMQNQDPLNPMDNAQMTSQIAQINTVGGIEKLNTTVNSLLASFNALQAQSATQLPGREVMVAGNAITLASDGNGANTAAGGVELASAADAVSVDILDSTGTPVRTLSLGAAPAGVRSFGWDGKAADGSDVPAGSYRMKVTATAAGKAVSATALTAARVMSVSNGTSGVQVDLGDAGVHPYTDLKSFL